MAAGHQVGDKRIRGFPCHPPQSVPYRGCPDPATEADCDPGRLCGSYHKKDNRNTTVVNPLSAAEKPVKVGFPFEDGPAEGADSQTLFPVNLIGNGELVAAFRATTGENLAAVFSGHPGSKTVGARTTALAGLKSTLHCRESLISYGSLFARWYRVNRKFSIQRHGRSDPGRPFPDAREPRAFRRFLVFDPPSVAPGRWATKNDKFQSV